MLTFLFVAVKESQGWLGFASWCGTGHIAVAAAWAIDVSCTSVISALEKCWLVFLIFSNDFLGAVNTDGRVVCFTWASYLVLVITGWAFGLSCASTCQMANSLAYEALAVFVDHLFSYF